MSQTRTKTSRGRAGAKQPARARKTRTRETIFVRPQGGDRSPREGQPKQRVRRSAKDFASFPSWKDIEIRKNRRSKGNRAYYALDSWSTMRMAAVIIVVAACFTAYVGHVHATQDVLARLEEARSDNDRLHLKYNRVKGAFDHATGPSIIARRARTLGLVEGLPAGAILQAEQ